MDNSYLPHIPDLGHALWRYATEPELAGHNMAWTIVQNLSEYYSLIESAANIMQDQKSSPREDNDTTLELNSGVLAARRAGLSSWNSKWWPTWFVPNWVSNPSTVRLRSATAITPAEGIQSSHAQSSCPAKLWRAFDAMGSLDTWQLRTLSICASCGSEYAHTLPYEHQNIIAAVLSPIQLETLVGEGTRMNAGQKEYLALEKERSLWPMHIIRSKWRHEVYSV